jgi:hypothetical protein
MSALLAKITLANIAAALIGANVAAVASLAAQTIWDHADVWAPAVNTALLVVLAILARRNSTKIDEAHASVHQTAWTAAKAAEAATEAARVAKAIGATIRTDRPIEP